VELDKDDDRWRLVTLGCGISRQKMQDFDRPTAYSRHTQAAAGDVQKFEARVYVIMDLDITENCLKGRT
jgi:hypothetical protein